MTVDDILNPVQGNGSYAADFPLFGGQNIWKAVPRDHRGAARRRPPAGHRARIDAQLPALLAPQDAGDLPRRGAVVRAHGRRRRACSPRTRRRRRCARWRWTPSTQTGFYPENGRARLRDMIANRPDWCISRQRSWGVPLPFFLHKDTRRAAPAHDGDPRPGRRHRRSRAASRPGAASTAEEILGADDAPHYTKSSDILEVWFDSGSHLLPRAARHAAPAAAGPPRQRPRGRPLPGRPRPAPRLVPSARC